MPPITVAVIAADRLVRAGLVSLLQDKPDLSAVISLAPVDVQGLEHRPRSAATAGDDLANLAETFAKLSDYVIITGYGETGQGVATALDEAEVPYAIATLSPTGATQAEEKGRKVVRGYYTKGYILELVGLQRARLLTIPDDEPAMAHRTISVALAAYPDLAVVAYAPYSGAVQELKAAGAAAVGSADHAATKLVVGEVRTERASVARAGLEF